MWLENIDIYQTDFHLNEMWICQFYDGLILLLKISIIIVLMQNNKQNIDWRSTHNSRSHNKQKPQLQTNNNVLNYSSTFNNKTDKQSKQLDKQYKYQIKNVIHSKRYVQQYQKNFNQSLDIKISANKIKLQKRIKNNHQTFCDTKAAIDLLKKQIQYLQSESTSSNQGIGNKNYTRFPKKQQPISPKFQNQPKEKTLTNNFFLSKEKFSIIAQNRRKIKKLKSFSIKNNPQNINWAGSNTINNEIFLQDLILNNRPLSSTITNTRQEQQKNRKLRSQKKSMNNTGVSFYEGSHSYTKNQSNKIPFNLRKYSIFKKQKIQKINQLKTTNIKWQLNGNDNNAKAKCSQVY